MNTDGNHTTASGYLSMGMLRKKLGNRARSSIYLDVKNGRLPKPKLLGGRLYWQETGVDRAMSDLPDAD